MAAFSTTTTAVPRRMAYLTSLQDLLPFMSQPIIDHIVTPLYIDFFAEKPSRDCLLELRFKRTTPGSAPDYNCDSCSACEKSLLTGKECP